MFRSILRTSRWLARKQIISYTPILLRPRLERVQLCEHPRNSCKYSTTSDAPQLETIDPALFEEICNETLESLTDYFEELIDDAPNLKGADVTYSVSKEFSYHSCYWYWMWWKAENTEFSAWKAFDLFYSSKIFNFIYILWPVTNIADNLIDRYYLYLTGWLQIYSIIKLVE